MGMMKEFREFAVQGNVVDLAVGVIIGAAFGKIVDSLIKDIVMPIIGMIFGGVDFSNRFIVLGTIPADYKDPMTYEALSKAGVALLGYGNFITIVINFVILAFVIFQMVRIFNAARRRAMSEKVAEAPAPAAAPADPEDVVLLREIRDALKAK